jgi:starch phosphorylase
MANLAIVGSHNVNGVAAIHSNLLKTDVFPDFHEFFPKKFMNITNGVTPRRWLHQANPQLSLVISTWLQTQNWILNLDLLSGLRQLSENPNLQKQWAIVKRQNKEKLAEYVEKNLNLRIPVDALYDVQVKRMHEYKRQLMNILWVIHRYETLKKMTPKERSSMVKRVVFFGGKAAPGYFMAKLVIRLINSAADVINKDKDTNDYLKVVFIPNYFVSLAELIVPATEISQHISTAGMEASGTSNMKFAMNGSLIIGTMDGANVEIWEEIGDENIFIFGTRAHDVTKMREKTRNNEVKVDERMASVLKSIEAGRYGDSVVFHPIINSLKYGNDYYLLIVDFPLCKIFIGKFSCFFTDCEAQAKVDETYKKPALWLKKSIMSTAGSGKFSTDRTIKEYATKVWGIQVSIFVKDKTNTFFLALSTTRTYFCVCGEIGRFCWKQFTFSFRRS